MTIINAPITIQRTEIAVSVATVQTVIAAPVYIGQIGPSGPTGATGPQGPPGPGNLLVAPDGALTQPGIFVQTGLGDTGQGITIWIEDGEQ